MTLDYHSLFKLHNNYIENSILQERVLYADITRLIHKFQKNINIGAKTIGNSIEEREINLITLGSGKRKILAWSQMHGDEPTATAALFDLINFLTANDQFNEIRNYILSEIELNVIPMLNPDGAEKHIRENSFNIDINRDALRKTSNESKLLWDLAGKIKPQFAFNLHDQNSYYTAGRTNNTAAISLLAPPIDYDKNVNDARLKSMQVIVKIYEALANFYPNNIARYNDDFEPRAFGDNFTINGISSILIESGYLKNDNNKSVIRKLNFIALISALKTIADNDFKKNQEREYFAIPENYSLLFDLLIRNVIIVYNGKKFQIDIGIKREKTFDPSTGKFYYTGKIAEVGDLSIYYGIEEYNLEGFFVKPAKIYDSNYSNKSLHELLSEGYGYIKRNSTNLNTFTSEPINYLTYSNFKNRIAADEYANMIFYQNEKTKYIVLNGFFEDVSNFQNKILNGVVIH